MSSLPTNGQYTVGTDPVDLIDLAAVLQQIWQNKFRILGAGFTGVGLAWVWLVYFAVPIYDATASLHRSAPVMKMPSLSGLMPGLPQADSAGHTEVELLRARSLLQQTIEALDLDQDPEFNPVLRPETVSDQVMRALKLKPALSVFTSQAIMNLTADTLAAAIVVRNVPDTTVFDISVSSERSEVAARVANFLAEKHIRRSEAARLERMKVALRWLGQQAQHAQVALRQAENEVAEFSAKMELINEVSLFALQRELKELRSSIAELEMRKITQPDRLSTLRKFALRKTKTLALQSRDLLQLKTLKREVNDLRLLRENINTERLSTHLSLELSPPEITLLSAAEVSIDPSRPQPKLLLLMGFFLGMISYLFTIMIRDPFAFANQALSELETQSRQPVFGCLPTLPAIWSNWCGDAQTPAPLRQMQEARVIAKVLDCDAINPPTIIVLGAPKTRNMIALMQGLSRQAKRTGKRVAVIGGVTKRFFPWAETPFSSAPRPDPNLRHSSPANDLINLVFVSNPLAPPKHNKELVQAVKAASGEYGLCLLPAPPVWSYQDISDLILAIENCIVAIDMKTIKPTQISDLICTLEVASSQPSGWILYNAPLEWVRQKSIKKQARQLGRSACAVYS